MYLYPHCYDKYDPYVMTIQQLVIPLKETSKV